MSVFRFADHINIMFSERREFDEDNKYTQENLRVYFKDLDTNKGYTVDKEKTLGEVLGDKRRVASVKLVCVCLYLDFAGLKLFLVHLRSSS